MLCCVAVAVVAGEPRGWLGRTRPHGCCKDCARTSRPQGDTRLPAGALRQTSLGVLGSPCEQPQLHTFFFCLFYVFFLIIVIMSIELNYFVTSRCCRSCCSRATSLATAAAGTYGWRPVMEYSVGKRTLMRIPATVGSSLHGLLLHRRRPRAYG